MRLSSRNSLDSLSMCKMISVPLDFLLDFSIEYSGDPSQIQWAAGSFL